MLALCAWFSGGALPDVAYADSTEYGPHSDTPADSPDSTRPTLALKQYLVPGIRSDTVTTVLPFTDVNTE